MIQRVNDKQLLMMKLLGTYKFLTYEQMTTLGVDKHLSNLSSCMGELIEAKFCNKIPNKIGQKMKVYLTAKGAKYLEDTYGLNPHYPKSLILTDTQDQKHRTQTIDFHIQFRNHQVLFFDRYFDKVGNNRTEKNLKSKTAIGYSQGSLKPDVVFQIQTKARAELYLVEIENGQDKQKSYKKFVEHGLALVEGAVNRKYGINYAYRVLIIFENESNLKSTLEMVRQNSYFSKLTEYFLLKTIEADCFDGWINLEGKKRKLYYE